MNAGLDPTEEDRFRDEVRRFLEQRLPRRSATSPVAVLGAGRDDREGGKRLLQLLDEAGLAAPSWPVRWGGLGASRSMAAVFHSELARFETPDLYPFVVGLALVGPTLLTHGSADQLERWLPPIRCGEEIWCQLFSEPGAGSDLAALSTAAVRDGDAWRITGQKTWSSRAHYSEWGLLLARTDRSVPKHSGITAFGLPMSSGGVSVRPMRQMNGDTHFNEVFLDEVVVSDAYRIGAEGEGWRVALTTLAHERSAFAGGRLGPGRDQLIDLLRSGPRDAVSEVRRDRVADVVARMELQRMSALRTQATVRAGRQPGPEGSGVKLNGGATLRRMGDVVMSLLGPAGVVGEGDWQTLFLTTPSISIRGGTDEIQRNIIGERILGLPAEPRVDKGVALHDTPTTSKDPADRRR